MTSAYVREIQASIAACEREEQELEAKMREAQIRRMAFEEALSIFQRTEARTVGPHVLFSRVGPSGAVVLETVREAGTFGCYAKGDVQTCCCSGT